MLAGDASRPGRRRARASAPRTRTRSGRHRSQRPAGRRRRRDRGDAAVWEMRSAGRCSNPLGTRSKGAIPHAITTRRADTCAPSSSSRSKASGIALQRRDRAFVEVRDRRALDPRPYSMKSLSGTGCSNCTPVASAIAGQRQRPDRLDHVRGATCSSAVSSPRASFPERHRAPNTCARTPARRRWRDGRQAVRSGADHRDLEVGGAAVRARRRSHGGDARSAP